MAGAGNARGELTAEINALAALLADVVELAGKRTVFRTRLEVVAELAMGHDRLAVSRQEEDRRS